MTDRPDKLTLTIRRLGQFKVQRVFGCSPFHQPVDQPAGVVRGRNGQAELVKAVDLDGECRVWEGWNKGPDLCVYLQRFEVYNR